MKRHTIADHVSRHTFLNTGTNFLKVVIGSFLLVFVARRLGPSQYGIVSLSLSIAAIVGILCDFGISTSTARFIAEDVDRKSEFYYNGLLLNIFFSFIASLALFIFAKPISVMVNINSPLYIQIVSVFTLFTSLFHFSIRSLQGIKETQKIALLNFSHNIITSIILFFIVFIGYKATGVLFGHSSSAVIIWILSILIILKFFSKSNFQLSSSKQKKIFNYALPLMITSSSYFLLLRGPSVLLSSFVGTTEVSYLNIPLRIVEVATLPAYSLTMVTSPFFTKSVESSSDLAWLYKNVLKYIILFYAPISVFITMGAYKIIILVFGVSYSNAIPVLIVFSLFLPFFVIATFSSRILDFLGIAKQKSIVFTITAFVTVVSSFFIIPRYKEFGAALVIAIPYTLFSLYTIVRSAQECGVKLSKYYISIIKLVATTLASCIPALIILYITQGLISLVLSFLCLVLSFALLCKLLRLVEISKILKIIKLLK